MQKNTLFCRLFPSFFLGVFVYFNASNHQHQILPGGFKGVTFLIKNWEFKCPGFQFHLINYKTSAFQVENLHSCATPVNEDKYLSVLHIAFHIVCNNAAKGIKAFPHIRWIGIKIVLH